MRVLQAKTKRPLDVLAIGSQGHVAAASSAFGVRGDVDVWEVASGRVVNSFAGERERSSLAFLPDGARLLVGGETSVVLVNVMAGGPPGRLVTSQSPSLAVWPNAARLLVTDLVSQSGRGRVVCYALGDPTAPRAVWSENPGAFGGFHFYDCPAVSPDRRWAAVAEHYSTGSRTRNTVQIRAAETGTVRNAIEFGAANPIEQLLFSADSSKLLARSSGRIVKVFDTETGQPAGELVHPGRPYVSGMAVHPNGTVACSRNNGTVCLWNLETRELVRTLDWKLGKLVSVAFSPDGTVGAAGTEDGRVVVWDVDA